MIYDITPCPKPRMTQRDKWKKRPCVLRYRAFCDEARFKIKTLPERFDATFYIPMPKSWSLSKCIQMVGMPHTVKPDLDNLLKALLDALWENDQELYECHIHKRWADKGAIEIKPL